MRKYVLLWTLLLTIAAYSYGQSQPVMFTQVVPQLETVYIDAGAMVPRLTNGPGSGTTEYPTSTMNWDYMAFDATTMECADVKLVFPENWDLGTVKAKVYWSSPNGSSSGDTVQWAVSGRAFGDGDAIDTASGVTQIISDTLLAGSGVSNQVTGPTPAITIAGTPVLNDMVQLTVCRDVNGADDMAEDGWLYGVLIQYGVSGAVNAW